MRKRRAAKGPADRYGAKPGPASAASNERPSIRRPDLTELLGDSLLKARVQQICGEWGLRPYAGTGLARSYVAREAGVELAADTVGTVTAIFLHFHGDDGFGPYEGELPGGTLPRRAALWSALGRPAEVMDRYLGDFGPSDTWHLAAYDLNARYTADADHLQRLTLTARPARPW